MVTTEALTRFLADQLPDGCVGAVRPIHEDDDRLLRPLEACGLERAVAGYGGQAARDGTWRGRSAVVWALTLRRSRVYTDAVPYGRRASSARSHTIGTMPAAAVAREDALSGVGIDIEPSERLPDGIADLVASEEELAAFAGVAFGEKAILSIKEAVYKAVHARDGIFLEFGDVRVCRHLCTATTKYGRVVGWRVTTAPRVLAVAGGDAATCSTSGATGQFCASARTTVGTRAAASTGARWQKVMTMIGRRYRGRVYLRARIREPHRDPLR